MADMKKIERLAENIRVNAEGALRGRNDSGHVYHSLTMVAEGALEILAALANAPAGVKAAHKPLAVVVREGERDVRVRPDIDALQELPPGEYELYAAGVLVGDQGCAAHGLAYPCEACAVESNVEQVLDAFERKDRGIPQAYMAADLVRELRAAIAGVLGTPERSEK